MSPCTLRPLRIAIAACGLAAILGPGGVRADDLDSGLAAYRARDYAQALLLLQPLAERGEARAQYTLGQMYRYGRGFVPSAAEALPWLRQAADSGYVPAMIALADLYAAGEHVAQDIEAAMQWLRRAADAGDAKGQLQLGVLFIRAEPVRDFAQAAMWLRRAAEQNEPEAQYFLARLLLDGQGVERDRAQAMVWLQRAGTRGHAPAQRFLKLLKQAETPERDVALRDLRRQLSAGSAQLDRVSSDPKFGFDKTQPVKTGDGYPGEWRYLNALRGPRGEVVHYERLDACCPFDGPADIRGKAFLDRYRLSYDGLDQPLELYLDMFEAGPTPAPAGFGFAPEPGFDD